MIFPGADSELRLTLIYPKGWAAAQAELKFTVRPRGNLGGSRGKEEGKSELSALP